MDFKEIIIQSFDVLSQLMAIELVGLIFGLITVFLLIKENIWAWPTGIAYVLASFVIFWDQRLFGDFLLHIVFLVLNIYGWYLWLRKPGDNQKEELHISSSSNAFLLKTGAISVIGILLFGLLLSKVDSFFDSMPKASLPYWDSATSILSITAMWLTARKKLENWHFWLVVDIIAVGIYYYKGIYFYSLLYLVYIGMAISGYLSWKKSMTESPPIDASL